MAGKQLVLLALLGLVASSWLHAGCSSSESRAVYHVKRGREFVADEKIAAAKIEFRSALNFDGNNVDANVELANLAERENNHHDAIFYLRDALAADASNDDVILRLATLLRDDQPWRARQLLMTAIARNPDNAIAHLGLSQHELSIGQPDQALASVARAIELDPTIPGSYWQLGIVYESMIERASKATGTIDYQLRDDAVRAFEDFVANGGLPEWKARLEQARILGTGDRNRGEAINAARRALEAARSADGDQPKLLAARHLASVSRAARDRAAYADAIEALLEVTPHDLHAWKNLAELRAASGGSAESVYKDLLARYPVDPDVHALYARHIGFTKGFMAAVDYYNRTIDKGIEPSRLLSSLRSYQIAYRMLPLADQTLTRMRNEFPGDPWTRLEEAKQLSTDGFSPAAIEALEKLVAEYEIPEAFEVLARLESFHHKFKRAAEHARLSVELNGYYEIRLHRLLAEVLFQAGEYAAHLEAIEVIERYDDLTNDQLLEKASSLYATDKSEDGRKILLELVEDPQTQITATLDFVHHEATNRQQAHVARKLVIAALEKHPENHDLLIAHADLNLQMGRPDLALAVLDRFNITDFPPPVRYMRAKLRAEQGNIIGAFPDLELALRADPLIPGLLDFAVILYSTKNVSDKRLETISRWIDSMRANPTIDWLTNARRISQLHLLRSRLFHKAGRNEEAIEVLEKAISNFEFAADTRIDLTYLLAITNKDIERAIEIAEDVADTVPPNPRALDALGLAYLTAKQPHEALRSFELANQAFGDANALFLYHESIALREVGRDRDALERIERVIAIDPSFPNAKELRQSLVGKNQDASKPS